MKAFSEDGLERDSLEEQVAEPNAILLKDFRADGLALEDHPAFQRHLKKLHSWEWNFGSSPQFSISFDKKFSWAFVVSNNIDRLLLTQRKRVPWSVYAALRATLFAGRGAECSRRKSC